MLSGTKGEEFDLNFRIMENKFSKQGYHIIAIKKYGEIFEFEIWHLIIKYPTKKSWWLD